MTSGHLRSRFRRHDRENRQSDCRQYLHKFAF
jgi:hypothetical protein